MHFDPSYHQQVSGQKHVSHPKHPKQAHSKLINFVIHILLLLQIHNTRGMRVQIGKEP